MASTETMEENLLEQAKELRSETEGIRAQLSETGEKIRNQAGDSWDDLMETIKRHPGKALGITLAAGFAVGSLATAAATRRRRYNPADQLRGIAGNGADAWDRVKTGLGDAMCTLRDAVNDAVKKLN